MKLEDLLGKELYAQVQAKLDEVNAKEPDMFDMLTCQKASMLERANMNPRLKN